MYQSLYTHNINRIETFVIDNTTATVFSSLPSGFPVGFNFFNSTVAAVFSKKNHFFFFKKFHNFSRNFIKKNY